MVTVVGHTHTYAVQPKERDLSALDVGELRPKLLPVKAVEVISCW